MREGLMGLTLRGLLAQGCLRSSKLSSGLIERVADASLGTHSRGSYLVKARGLGRRCLS